MIDADWWSRFLASMTARGFHAARGAVRGEEVRVWVSMDSSTATTCRRVTRLDVTARSPEQVAERVAEEAEAVLGGERPASPESIAELLRLAEALP